MQKLTTVGTYGGKDLGGNARGVFGQIKLDVAGHSVLVDVEITPCTLLRQHAEIIARNIADANPDMETLLLEGKVAR